MAKGKHKHEERLAAISFWGKDLARRANKRCELCEGNGDLRPLDLDPDAEPSMESLALLCSRCRELADGKMGDLRSLRFLETAIWNELSLVSELAKKILANVAQQKGEVAWAREALETCGYAVE